MITITTIITTTNTLILFSSCLFKNSLFAVYQTEAPLDFSVETGKNGLSLVPVLFMGLIRHGEKTMVEGFFASSAINSCEDTQGFKGYASSLAHAEKLYA